MKKICASLFSEKTVLRPNSHRSLGDSEIAVALGLDWVVIDAEHGHLDWKEILEHVRASVRSETVVLVRVAELNGGLIKRALDIGADGVVIPWVETAEHLEQAVMYAMYPPTGRRGIGAERATCWGQCFEEHIAEANDAILVVPIIESMDGIRNIEQLARVNGVEVFFFGPADLSATAGHAGQWEGPGVREAISTAVAHLHGKAKHTGVVATSPEDFRQREQDGFRMLGLGLDAGLLIRALRRDLEEIGCGGRVITSDLRPSAVEIPKPTSGNRNCSTEALADFRPDRMEVMTGVGSGRVVEIEPGVDFEVLVGAHNGAVNLTTGLLRFAAGANVPYHTHTFTESVTVLEGGLLVEVEGRCYRLGPMDNITIPAGSRHAAVALPGGCVAHGILATSSPDRTLVEPISSKRSMADDVSGLVGPEYITRFQTAHRYEAGPNTEFIDFFNARLVPGIEISGGYGLFHHGGRLPAHIHDFDESITIIEGEALCNVEGRHYSMRDRATALQPRGRVHYFINETHRPMAMLWVYAGPMPERIEFDDLLTVPGANPWRE